MNFNGLLDFEVDPRGSKFETHHVQDEWIYFRGQNYGHVKNIVTPRRPDGSADWSRAREFPEKTQAIAFIYKESGVYPERYVCSQAREILKQYGK